MQASEKSENDSFLKSVILLLFFLRYFHTCNTTQRLPNVLLNVFSYIYLKRYQHFLPGFNIPAVLGRQTSTRKTVPTVCAYNTIHGSTTGCQKQEKGIICWYKLLRVVLSQKSAKKLSFFFIIIMIVEELKIQNKKYSK